MRNYGKMSGRPLRIRPHVMKGYDEGGDVESDSDSDDSGKEQATGGNGFGATLRGISPIGKNADWNKFEKEARPSTNIDDDRDRGWSKYIPNFGSFVAVTGGKTDAGD